MKENKEQIYFQDIPIKNFSEDYVGFNEEVRMINEAIESDCKIIGLISEYGSGKSSIIELVKKTIDTSKFNIFNINLFDPNDSIDGLETHKRMIIQLANYKYANDKSKLSYIVKRINPNYKSIDISTKNKMSYFWIAISLLLFCISFLYKNDILRYLNFLDPNKNEFIINIIKSFCKLSGITGFLILFLTFIKGDFVFNYLKNDDKQELNEFDLIEISKDLLDDSKITIIIIEDLDRVNDSSYIEEFIKEINLYYKSLSQCKFIISITPEKYKILTDTSKKERIDIVDSKYKLFNMIIDLPKIKNSDYGLILEGLLISKKKEFKNIANINIDDNLKSWHWLSRGKKMNLRRLKHRINNVIHLYLTLKSRFPQKYIDLKTCIAICYLRDEYEEEYEKMIEETDNFSFELKSIIEKYITGKLVESDLSGIYNDVYLLIKAGFIDYNCEMYCFNYSKYNIIFDGNENQIINDYIFNRDYKIDNKQILEIINNNSTLLNNTIMQGFDLGIGIPSNVFSRISILNYVLKSINLEQKKKFYNDYLLIDENHINSTISRLNRIIDSDFFSDENLDTYFQYVTEEIKNNSRYDNITASRIELLKLLKSKCIIIHELYTNEFPLITIKEMNLLNNLKDLIKLINFKKISMNSIIDITKEFDRLYTNDCFEDLLDFLKSLDSDSVIDYFLKNSETMSVLTEEQKKIIFNKYFNKMKVSNINEIENVIHNFNYCFEILEDKVISLLNNNNLTIEKYEEFINKIPNFHDNTLNKLLDDECNFKISNKILNSFREKKEKYGYIKFKTINEEKISDIKRKYVKEYEKLYSNEKFIFNDYIKSSPEYLLLIRNEKIYLKYDSHRLILMSNCVQNSELLEYVLEKITDISMLNEYFSTIRNIDCSQQELVDLFNKYSNKIKMFDKGTRNNLIKCLNNRSLKAKFSWIFRR